MQKGHDYEKNSKYTQAIDEYRKVLETKPSYQPARWRLALTYMENDHYEEAVKELEKLKEDDKNSWEYRYKSGVCRYRLHDPAAALEEFQTAGKLYKNKDKSSIFFMILGEALAYSEMKNYRTAEEKIRRAHKLHPSTLSSGELSRILYLNGKKKEAVKLAEDTLEKDPKQKAALITLMLNDLDESRISKLSQHFNILAVILEKENNQSLPYSLHDLVLRASLKLRENGDEKLSGRGLALVDREFVLTLPDQERSKYFLAYADSLYFKKKLTDAVTNYEDSGESKEAYWGLARSYALLKDEVKAMFYLDKAAGFRKEYYNQAQSDPAFYEMSTEFKKTLYSKGSSANMSGSR
jgi:tetratricopeptide (TPR) repeat protein